MQDSSSGIKNSSTDAEHWDEMYDVMARTLRVTIDEITAILKLQGEFTDTITNHVQQLCGIVTDPQQKEYMGKIVASAQSEDYLRQRQGQVVGVLEEMRNILVKARDIEPNDANTNTERAVLLSDGKNDMLERVVMQEMRTALAHTLNLPVKQSGDHKKDYVQGNDVELF